MPNIEHFLSDDEVEANESVEPASQSEDEKTQEGVDPEGIVDQEEILLVSLVSFVASPNTQTQWFYCRTELNTHTVNVLVKLKNEAFMSMFGSSSKMVTTTAKLSNQTI